MSRHCALFLVLASAMAASARDVTHLWVSSYSGGDFAGNITALALTSSPSGTYALSEVPGGRLNTSANSPSWLEYDDRRRVLYLIDEAINASTHGNVVAYRTEASGRLTELARSKAPIGGVSAAFYAQNEAMAVAHYTGGILQALKLSEGGSQRLLHTVKFSKPDFRAGPIAARQEASHPHQALLDPTGKFILVPDLGYDEIHVLGIDKKDLKLSLKTSIKVAPGYGPRHGAFSLAPIGDHYIFYLVGELVAQVAAFKVEYGKDSLQLKKISSYSTLDEHQRFPLNADGSTKVAPAEVHVTPDGKKLIVSNRNDTTFGTAPPTDSLAYFEINPENGKLEKLPPVSAFGSFPRHFSLNREGNLLAVATQRTGRVSILQKDVKTGLFNAEVAGLNLPVGADTPTCVVWDR